MNESIKKKLYKNIKDIFIITLAVIILVLEIEPRTSSILVSTYSTTKLSLKIKKRKYIICTNREMQNCFRYTKRKYHYSHI